MEDLSFSTGIVALDEVLDGIHPGDNIVFQVDNIEDYIPFVHAFCIDNEKEKRPLIYFRFAEHTWLIPDGIQTKVFYLHPSEGFEHFIDEVFTVIEKYGRGACYVFDSLSELAVDWYSDRMVANFFMLTCPYLFDFETETYFALIRNKHSQYTIQRIYETAQIILDVYNEDNMIYLHPLKVWKRYSSTMYMLHVWKDNKFVPLLKSAETSEILTKYAQPWVDLTTRIQDIWSKTFNQAHKILEEINSGKLVSVNIEELKERMIRMMLTRDPKLFPRVQCYMSLEDLIEIGRRMIGTGLIGGKALGMLLAQSILKESNSKWKERLEQHDSFCIGSDVFYSYLVINNCWWKRYRIRKTKDYGDLAAQARKILENGKFPEDIIEQFKNMLSYFGQSPIIVRSSSLLEDAYGNAFSGKYESIFLANQGTPEKRLNKFINAVRKVYRSTLSDKALNYRLRRGLLDKDEQMAVLVQRVSGTRYGNLFYPQLAGVGYSFNPFIWDPAIKPREGMIRLVFGLGTRAVERYDDDYTRIIALSAPEKRPESNKEEKHKYTQKKVDLLNLKKNEFNTQYFDKIALESKELPLRLFSVRDYEVEMLLKERGKERIIYLLDLDKVASREDIMEDMREILHTLEAAYESPIDIEFAINFLNENTYKIYVLQCRPFQIKSKFDEFQEPRGLTSENILLKTFGPIIGNGLGGIVDRMIYVDPSAYGELPIQDRYKVARIIGKLNHLDENLKHKTIFLAGPGRWATSSPSLGVPVSFHEIDTVSIICEISEIHAICPDVSLGTHFFNDLVEHDMVYVAVKKDENSILNKKKIKQFPNRLIEILPNAIKYQNLIYVIDGIKSTNHSELKIYADPIKQLAILYLE
ncbi:MAG: pyruvate, phosphate dikinase [Candidatus Lokiarchaeota archaeon]|nr:pyruvate, phosphate dikinase [Candidatus Lokiarchaeota archaeon]MBD3337864.1 pyruvate, phosphate dikinase [Candidatus Lokiarchaeota archaeon]